MRSWLGKKLLNFQWINDEEGNQWIKRPSAGRNWQGGRRHLNADEEERLGRCEKRRFIENKKEEANEEEEQTEGGNTIDRCSFHFPRPHRRSSADRLFTTESVGECAYNGRREVKELPGVGFFFSLQQIEGKEIAGGKSTAISGESIKKRFRANKSTAFTEWSCKRFPGADQSFAPKSNTSV